MTDPDTLDLINRAVEVAVQRAQRSLVQPQFLFGALIGFDVSGNSIHEVLLDGDSEPVEAMDVSNINFVTGDRVCVAFSPPHQFLIIGIFPG